MRFQMPQFSEWQHCFLSAVEATTSPVGSRKTDCHAAPENLSTVMTKRAVLSKSNLSFRGFQRWYITKWKLKQQGQVLTSLRITSLESANRSINLETPADGYTNEKGC